MKPELQAALANGAVVVTANRRQARLLQREFAASVLAQGMQAWPTPSILSHDAWLQALWLDALATDALGAPPRLLTPTQSAYAWQGIVDADSIRSAPLIDARGAAALASDAWELMHAWGAGGESWRGWPRLALSDDQAAFVSWAESYAAQLADTNSVDHALLPDLLARCASVLTRGRKLDVVLVGFIEETPQQLRLAKALADAGASIARVDLLPAEQGKARRMTAATPGDELAHALAWARVEVTARPASLVAIAVEDLAKRRLEVRALAEDILCPALQWPGREEETRPFNISLGGRLVDEPLVGAALDLLVWGETSLPAERAAAALRSPYLVGADTMWMRRAGLELQWLKEGRREIGLNDVLLTLPKFDAALAERWRGASVTHRLPPSATPREWTEAWRDWLGVLGWPGDRALDSAEYQARQTWDELLSDFASIGAVENRLSRPAARRVLRALAAEKLHQPESQKAPVQILGLLEAQGLGFDALWIAGLGAERWPRAPEPNALLPIEWQREHDLPRSGAMRELRFARELTRRLRSGAPRIVLSYVRGSEDDIDSPSALILDVPEVSTDEIAAPVTTAQAQLAQRPALEATADDAAPPLPPGTRARGGAGLFEKQSDCPFRAVAIHRLRVDRWPRPVEGVSPLEHGLLVHAALAEFWRDLRQSDALRNLPEGELRARIDAAVARASEAALRPFRWRAMPPLVAEVERERVADIVRQWLELHERDRPPFRVLETELKLPLELRGLGVEVRLDRVDALESGGIGVIDYKTGLAAAPSRWFDARPQAPQLGLYMLAWLAAHPEQQVRAVAYAQLRRGELEVEGLAADGAVWPGLPLPNEVGEADLHTWADVEQRWRVSLGALAEEILRGHATVTPRKPSETCKRCGLQSLCRIGARGLAGNDEDGGETIDEA